MFTILIMSFNSRHLVGDLVKSIDEKIPIVIVENSQDYELKNRIEKLHKNVKFIIPEKNLGFAKGANLGIQYSINAKADYVWLLNNDTIVTKNSLQLLLNSFSINADYVGLTPKILMNDDPNLIWSIGCYFNWYGGLKRNLNQKKFLKTKGQTFPVSFITNCASIYPVKLFKEVGLLSEDIFMGEEDYDFSKRLDSLNYKLACNQDSVIYHKVGQSTKSVKKIGSLYAEYSCRLITIKKFYSKPVWYLSVFLYGLTILKISILKNEYSIYQGIKIIKLLLNSYSKNEFNKKNFFDALNIEI